MCWNIIGGDVRGLDVIADKVMAYIDMFRAGMQIFVMTESQSSLIVDVNFRWTLRGETEFREERANPEGFACSVRKGHILGFHRGKGGSRLFLGAPRDRPAESEDEARNGAAIC